MLKRQQGMLLKNMKKQRGGLIRKKRCLCNKLVINHLSGLTLSDFYNLFKFFVNRITKSCQKEQTQLEIGSKTLRRKR